MDWKEVFKNYKKCGFDDIVRYLSEVNNKKTAAYKGVIKKQVEEKNSYLEVKKGFYKEFFPEFIPVKQASVSKMKEAVANW